MRESSGKSAEGHEAFCSPLLGFGEADLHVQSNCDPNLARDRANEVKIFGEIRIARAFRANDVKTPELTVDQHRQDALGSKSAQFAKLVRANAVRLASEIRGDQRPQSVLA